MPDTKPYKPTYAFSVTIGFTNRPQLKAAL